jgi:hypothetical protein
VSAASYGQSGRRCGDWEIHTPRACAFPLKSTRRFCTRPLAGSNRPGAVLHPPRRDLPPYHLPSDFRLFVPPGGYSACCHCRCRCRCPRVPSARKTETPRRRSTAFCGPETVSTGGTGSGVGKTKCQSCKAMCMSNYSGQSAEVIVPSQDEYGSGSSSADLGKPLHVYLAIHRNLASVHFEHGKRWVHSFLTS